MTDVVCQPMISRADARMLVEQVKTQAEELWLAMAELHQRQAHLALGYTSWGEFCRDEFDVSQAQAYRLIAAGNVVAEIEEASESHSPVGEWPPTERVARELAQADNPVEAWEDVVELNGHKPTAEQTRDVVQTLRDPATDKQMGLLRAMAKRKGAVLPDGPISKAKASKLIDHMKGHECKCKTCGTRWAA